MNGQTGGQDSESTRQRREMGLASELRAIYQQGEAKVVSASSVRRRANTVMEHESAKLKKKKHGAIITVAVVTWFSQPLDSKNMKTFMKPKLSVRGWRNKGKHGEILHLGALALKDIILISDSSLSALR